jgi:hypothetical protein
MPTSFADFELTEEEVELEDLAEPDGRLGDIFGFTPNLSARDSKAMDKLKCEIGIAASLCGLIAEKCFPSKLVVHN